MNNVTLDIKVQDKLRELFSKRGSDRSVKITNISLGDSDIDYDLSQQREIIKCFKTPFNVNGIKHKLIYEGEVNNISGTVQTNIIKLTKNLNNITSLNSLYNYPPDSNTFIPGKIKPTLENAYNASMLDFGPDLVDIGYVVFAKTMMDNYYSKSTGKPLRLEEGYTISLSSEKLNFNTEGNIINSDILPGGLTDKWEIIYDEENSSFSICKPASYSSIGEKRVIELLGKKTGIKKQLIIQI